MNERENRDDLVKRVIDQNRQHKKGELTSKEIKDIEKMVVRDILPRVYKDKK